MRLPQSASRASQSACRAIVKIQRYRRYTHSTAPLRANKPTPKRTSTSPIHVHNHHHNHNHTNPDQPAEPEPKPLPLTQQSALSTIPSPHRDSKTNSPSTHTDYSP
ncbi:hypothetical protein BO70DRAFT_16561 [Aspergillus heteromorphus CBS 117.55]|uniref:Uncharacterized protein n=1 Tax=Aspergillus heteromorphus CBS 117.55 TaxID=1448321 RepID=A0A317X298_9EURO|nr:uncharacterized protein BO70DRAFT_16561 [Aspergillus heteromorphus CBS 117.55]PWY92683.1 hypothetical protein BO70DRAFT_16561 [Aspergillus heteromorphus CBS 117.55]